MYIAGCAEIPLTSLQADQGLQYVTSDDLHAWG